MTYVLGIESTAHTFGAAVVDLSGNILSNVKDSYTSDSTGMIPVKLAEHHVACAPDVIRTALSDAGVSMNDIVCISFSQSPGIGHALRIGGAISRSLALRHAIPLIGVNHCVAHLHIGQVLSGETDPVLLYVSGANTQVIAKESGAYRIFGETLDIGIGNMLDSLARVFGLGFPGGPAIEQLAQTNDEEFLLLPYAVKGMDVSFTGLQSRVEQLRKAGHSDSQLAYSLQETAFAMLVEVAERALAHTGKTALVLGGGVACNKRLQEMAAQMCEQRGVRCVIPENQYLTDNAAMIALLGIPFYKASSFLPVEHAAIQPHLRTEEFVIPNNVWDLL